LSQEIAEYKPADVEIHNAVPLLDVRRYEHMARVAAGMAKASLIPDFLKGKSFDETFGNCMMVVNQSWNWGMDPFAVAQCMSLVYGKPCYEGKLISAVIRTLLRIELKYEWSGEEGTDQHRIRIWHPDVPEHFISGKVGDWKTFEKNGETKANWRGHAQVLQLKYRGDREWCRAWRPELILGVYTPDEMMNFSQESRARNATPIGSGLAGRLSSSSKQADGFSAANVRAELGDVVDQETGEITQQDTGRDASQNQVVSDLRDNGRALAETNAASGQAVASLAPETFRNYSKALFRAATPEGLKKMATAFWTEIGGWPPADPADKETANSIFALHLQRIDKKISPEDLERDIRELTGAE
jgi:hypothetical protein